MSKPSRLRELRFIGYLIMDSAKICLRTSLLMSASGALAGGPIVDIVTSMFAGLSSRLPEAIWTGGRSACCYAGGAFSRALAMAVMNSFSSIRSFLLVSNAIIVILRSAAVIEESGRRSLIDWRSSSKQISLSPFLSAWLKASRGLSFLRSRALSSFLIRALHACSSGTTVALAV